MDISHLAGFVAPCARSSSRVRQPVGADWLHAINRDGLRLVVMTTTAPRAIRRMAALHARSSVVDGQAVVPDGRHLVRAGRS